MGLAQDRKDGDRAYREARQAHGLPPDTASDRMLDLLDRAKAGDPVATEQFLAIINGSTRSRAVARAPRSDSPPPAPPPRSATLARTSAQPSTSTLAFQYASLRYATRAQLKKDDPAKFEKMHAAWQSTIDFLERARFQSAAHADREIASRLLRLLEAAPGGST